MSVEWVRLGDVLAMNRTPTNVDPGATYRPVGVRAFGRGIFDYAPTKGADLSKVRYFDLPAASLVISNIKGWEGAVAATEATEEGRIASSRFLTYQPSAEVDPRYVLHWLLSDGGLEVLRRCSPGSADRNRTLSRKGLEASLLPLPPIDEQRRIAAHLDLVGDLATRRAHATPLANAWPVALRDRLVSQDDVRRVPLRDILEMRPSEAVDPERTYRISGVYSFGRGLLDRGHLAGRDTKYAAMTSLHAGDVVYSKLGAFEDAVAVVDEEFAGSHVSPEFPVFRVASEVDPNYLRAALTTTSFAEALIRVATGVGARQKRVSPSSFLSLEVPIPSRSRQRRVAGILGEAMTITAKEERTRELSGALLPAARNEIFSAMR